MLVRLPAVVQSTGRRYSARSVQIVVERMFLVLTIEAEFEVNETVVAKATSIFGFRSLVSKKAVIIEFKRIRPNAVVVPEVTPNHSVKWSRQQYTDLFTTLENFSQEGLRSLDLAKIHVEMVHE